MPPPLLGSSQVHPHLAGGTGAWHTAGAEDVLVMWTQACVQICAVHLPHSARDPHQPETGPLWASVALYVKWDHTSS